MRKHFRQFAVKSMFTVLALTLTAALCSCRADGGKAQNSSYINITAEEAKEVMDSDSSYVIIDVRTEEEFQEGHIPGAILIPDYDIAERAEKELIDKDEIILVYCRSGNRSKKASETLAELGYTDVREFGGIIDWPYEVTK